MIEYIPGVMDFTVFYYAESRGGELLLSIVMFVWMAGVIFFFGQFLRGHLKFRRLLREAVVVENISSLVLLEECKASIGIKRRVRLVESENISVPAVAGLFYPAIILPKGMLENLDLQEMKYVFLHELAHSKHGDLWVLWLTRIVDVVHWFNPVVRFATSSLVRNCERACDARVLECLENQTQRHGYGVMLLKLASSLPANHSYAPAALFLFSRKEAIKQRIKSITRFRVSWFQRKKWALVLMLPVILVAEYKPAGYCVSGCLKEIPVAFDRSER